MSIFFAVALALSGVVSDGGGNSATIKLSRLVAFKPAIRSFMFASEYVGIIDFSRNDHNAFVLQLNTSNTVVKHGAVLNLSSVSAPHYKLARGTGYYVWLNFTIWISAASTSDPNHCLHIICRRFTMIVKRATSQNFDWVKFVIGNGDFRNVNICPQLSPRGIPGDFVAFPRCVEGRINQPHPNGAQANAKDRSGSHDVSPKRGLSLSYQILLVSLVCATFVSCLGKAVSLVERGHGDTAIPYIIMGIFGILGSMIVGLPLVFGGF